MPSDQANFVDRRHVLVRRRLVLRVLAPLAAILTNPLPCTAQGTLSIGSVAVLPGRTEVVVPISATTQSNLTGLNLQVEFDRSLCDLVANHRIEMAGRAELSKGRVIIDPAEVSQCPEEGRVSVVLIDLALEGDAPSVIPPGSGEIARWVAALREGATAGTFPLSLNILAARNGPTRVEIEPRNGRLVVTTCPGECDGSGTVTVDELVLGVGIALGTSPLSSCATFDLDGNGVVTVDELVGAVRNATDGCGG